MASESKNNDLEKFGVRKGHISISPTLSSTSEQLPTCPKNLYRSKSAGSASFETYSGKPLVLESKAGIVITKDALEMLISNLSLDEIEEVSTGKECLEDKKPESSENYFEACGSPGKISKLSPWTPDGPIVKSLPGFFKMSQMIADGTCICLLLGCDEEVFTQNIKNLGATPRYFMCREHRAEVKKRYGYGS